MWIRITIVLVCFGVVLLELLTKQRTHIGGTYQHICEWAASKVQVYEISELKDSALEAPDEAVVEFADIALDCVKVPGSRRPPMKEVARRLHALLSKHCSEEIFAPTESSMLIRKSAKESMVESLERLAGGGMGGDLNTFGKSEISEEL
ncbi:unnamed protein product [Closterium sp. Naga37s-1]|nr:unnamed protein product [Closterium sp. Naga37s-1]